MKSCLECLMPGLIPCAVSLCERSEVSLTAAALWRENSVVPPLVPVPSGSHLVWARPQKDTNMCTLHHDRNNDRRQRFKMNVVLMKSSFMVSLQLLI